MYLITRMCVFFFFNDTATTEIYTLSLHDALPISSSRALVYCRLTVLRLQDVTIMNVENTAVKKGVEIGRAHSLTPITTSYPMPSSSFKKKKKDSIQKILTAKPTIKDARTSDKQRA